MHRTEPPESRPTGTLLANCHGYQHRIVIRIMCDGGEPQHRVCPEHGHGTRLERGLPLSFAV
jgi:hypothetical protein